MTHTRLRELINEVIDYNWSDELRDWEEHGKPKTGHIFCDLKELDDYINPKEDEREQRSAPTWAWDVIDETLAADVKSKAFDPTLRGEIKKAVNSMGRL